MESRFNGVPISATQMGPEASSSYRGIIIRAPLTVDESDFEHSFSSPRNSTTSSYYSGSEFESEVYESEVEKDEGVIVETHLVDESEVSEHSLRSPDEEIGQESVDVDENDVFRPFVRIPDGKMYKGSSVVDDSDDSGSFLSDSGDELVKDEIFIAHLGDSRPLVAVDEAIIPVKDVRIPMVQKLHVPIAQISADSDDDSQFSGVSDEEGFSGIIRVPSVEILRRVDSASKVRVLETEGDGDEKTVDTEFVDGLVNFDDVLGSLEEMGDLDVKSSVNSSVSAGLGLEKGVDIGEEDSANSLVVDGEFCSTLESGKNGDLLDLDLGIQELEVIDEGNRSEKVESENEEKIVTTVEPFSSNASADLVLDKCVDIGEEDTANSLVVDEEFGSTLESGENGDNLHLGLEIQDEGNRSGKVENENEHEVISTDEPFSSNAADEMGFVQQCTSDSLSKDSSLRSVIDGGESLSECSDSGNKTRNEAVNWVPDSASFSNGEIGGEFEEASSETKKNKIEQNYLRLVHRLGRSSVDSEDLYHLILSDDQKCVSQIQHLDSIELAAQETDGLDFPLSILVIGKTGVGKSATINSIFGETKVPTNAFEPSTPRVREIVGAVNGVKLKVFDTPGLKTSSMDQATNRKILSSIKKVIRKSSPDVILYVDRLDARTSVHDLKSFASYLGPSMWRKSIIVFTHGASIPPDEEFVAQKSRAVRQVIGCSMAPVCVVENHPSLPDGERWRSEFLLLCCSMKILSDNVVPDVAPCCSHGPDQETGALETWAPPLFRRRSLLGWDRTGNADHFPAVQLSKNVTAAFDDHLRVRTRWSDVRVAAALWLVPIVRVVFDKIFGQSGEDCST